MSCYIASNDNRYYVSLEQDFGEVAAVTAANRIPAVKLAIRHAAELVTRRDKTGTRTYNGVPPSARKRVSYDLTTYMTAWNEDEAEPCYGPLVQASLGGLGISFDGATVAAVTNGTHITCAAPHSLGAGQAVRYESDIRFVANVIDEVTIVVNAPFTSEPGAGAELGKTITYMPAHSLPSVSLFDYWQPAEAVQRIVAGAAVDLFQLAVNSDFHQFRFTGEAADLISSSGFSEGLAGLTEFPEEPEIGPENFALVPGSMGQAWFGAEAAQFHTVVEAAIRVDNHVDLRRREFGMSRAGCIVTGPREVSLEMTLVSNTEAQTLALYEAAVQRSPIQAMLQLGLQERSLCGLYLPAVIPEVPEFLDDDVRLQWRFRSSRAQGISNDEVVIAFA